MTTCFLNIYCCFLPAHTSHILQPLDLTVFSSVKAAYRRMLAELASMSDSAPINKINFIRCYTAARKEGITPRNIRSGFKGTGIWPINRQIPKNNPHMKHPRPQTPEAPEESYTE